jgi:hypothetical protein
MPQSQESADVFLMPSLFNQTIHLLLEARNYFEHEGRLAEAELDIFQRPQFTTEMFAYYPAALLCDGVALCPESNFGGATQPR